MNPVTETVTGHGARVTGYKPRVTNTSHGSLARATGHEHEPRVTNRSHGTRTKATGHEHEPRVTSTKGRSVEA